MSAQSEADRVVAAVNQMADRFTEMQGEAMNRAASAPQIDLQGYGALIARVGHVEAEVHGLRADMAKVLETLQEAKGGWRTLMFVGGAAASLGSVLGGLVSWVFSHTPKG